MRYSTSYTLATASLVTSVLASYAPVPTTCPSTSLVRAATGLSDDEETYRVARKAKADVTLASWLTSTNNTFDVSGELPALGLANSGGSYRAFLIGAGVYNAMDGDGGVGTSVSGLYQALSYHSALSGGAWLLASIMSHNWESVSELLTLWEPAFANGLFDPEGTAILQVFANITEDLALKEAAGFRGTLTDLWSRALSCQMLPGESCGVDNTLSAITSQTEFMWNNVPYPIITAQHVDLSGTSCLPTPTTAAVWEFTPYEFGSWDSSIAAFTPTKYLGSTVNNGVAESCFTNYDNLGFVLGTSSSLFNDLNYDVDNGVNPPLLADWCGSNSDVSAIGSEITTLIEEIYTIEYQTVADLFAQWPNPFYNSAASPLVSSQANLSMVDGGQSGQTDPIFPMLVPERNISVILVNDNAGDTSDNYPNGTAIYSSYLSAQAMGMTRMPFIPTPSVFVAENMTERAVFFGCGDSSVATIVWLPNAPLTAAGGGTSTNLLTYNTTMTQSMIANGVAVMTQPDDIEWPMCLACVIMEGTGTTLPSECTACLAKYCYSSS
ncbi:hypothetical protein BP6252_06012 [Coleophoma cylindrospora]|uniref:Lysophospholipase n=1 Tax=Coleophoma cylindrospora TaxID=1849047 RepID=A0A3D8RLP2_9HELO|nr:hypothetical protein BP6252_06012 [Coleophoma cylindrospora]